MSAARTGALLLLAGLAAAPLTGCASGSGPRVRVLPPRPVSSVPTSAVPFSNSAIVRTALELLGAPYVLGGSTPSGFDCSGFVWYVYHVHGVDLPRGVATQAGAGRHVDRSDIRPGDLVFFSAAGSGFTHVGIATGANSFVHAPNSRSVVRVEPLNSPYWSRVYAGARRLISPKPVH